MNEYLKKIIEENIINERFRDLDFLLKHNIIDIKVLEDYYANNVSKDAILFAERYNSLIDIKKLEDAIIDLGDGDMILDFARNIKGANITKLEDAIIKKIRNNYQNVI